jgi:Fe-S cluster assembly iron-binding protein IscA
MIAVTLAALTKLRAIQTNHPEDPIVRISVRDVDDSRLSFSITLEANTQPDDNVQQIDGLTIAIDRLSAPRMNRVTVDYTESNGFLFLHNDEGRSLPLLTIPTLN